MAEREGFEPSIEFPLYTLSKRAPSTARPSLRGLREQWAKSPATFSLTCDARLNRVAFGAREQLFGPRQCAGFGVLARVGDNPR